MLTDGDWKQIEEISKNKYQTWEWNFGKSPKANISNSHRFPVGTIDVRLNVNRGVIEDVKIFGDFFGWGDIADIENKLKGVRYEKAAIIEALKDVNIQHYFGNIEKEDFIHLVY